MLSLDKYSVIQLQEFVMRAKESGLSFSDSPFGGQTEVNPVVEQMVVDVLNDALNDLEKRGVN